MHKQILDPRATQVCNKSDEEQEINQVISQLQDSTNVNAFFVLSKFIDCPEIKNQPEFCQILFNEHMEVVEELMEWMLQPKQVVKKKKIKANINVDSYPYQCREFMRDNWCFYEQMYIAARNKKLDFGGLFNFLRKQHFDKDTIYTALGYFADVMIPFAKYEFSGSFNLTKSFEVSSMSKNVETLSIMKILPEVLIDQLIKYCHYDAVYSFLKTAILVSVEDPRDYEISRTALLKLLKGAQVQNLFSKFPILTQQSNDEVARAMDYLENVANGVKQMSQNIELNSQSLFRTTAMIQAVIQSNIVTYVVKELPKSRLCGMMGKEKQKQRDRLHSSASNANDGSLSPDSPHGGLASSTGNPQQTNIPLNTNINVYNHSPLPALGSPVPLTDNDQEELVETLLKILSGMVEVFLRIPRTLNVIQDESKQEGKKQEVAQIIAQSPINNTILPKSFKQKSKEFTYQQYSAMTSQFRQQMQFLLDNMETLTKFVYNETQSGVGSSYAKIVPFASGENVKAISFMKYQFFKLIHNVLIMLQFKEPDGHPPGRNSTQNQNRDSKEIKDINGTKQAKQSTIDQNKQENRASIRKLKSIALQPFEFKIQKLHCIEIIKKYLSDNRWNNLAHHLLEKITHLLIMCSYEYIKKNIEKDKNKKFSDSFLAFLIENFTKRDFVFLNTVKFTTQGNLHSLYNIAKDLAYTLNSTNQLVLFLNEFEPWKKFIMTDLKNYEENTFPKAIKPEVQDQNENEQCSSLKVDEADSIKKLIENISTTKKWPTKTKNKSLSKSGVFEFRSSGDAFLKSQTQQHMLRTHGGNMHSTQKKQREVEDLEQILKRKIEYSKKNSEVRSFDIEEISVRDKLSQQNKKESKSLILQQVKSQSQLPKSQRKDSKEKSVQSAQ